MYGMRRSQPIRRVCPRCDGLGVLTAILYDPRTGKTVGETTIKCPDCR